MIQKLQIERDSVSQDASASTPEEPCVLVHGYLHGRNIMVNYGLSKPYLTGDLQVLSPLASFWEVWVLISLKPRTKMV